jgi:hypothetical protein
MYTTKFGVFSTKTEPHTRFVHFRASSYFRHVRLFAEIILTYVNESSYCRPKQYLVRIFQFWCSKLNFLSLNFL